MVQSSRNSVFTGWRRVATLALLGFVAACQTPEPVVVNATFVATPALGNRSPSQVAVLPVEDGTSDAAVQRHLVFLRQELMRQLPSRLFTPLTTSAVDAGLSTATKPVATESILVPSTLQKLAGHAAEDAVFALRVDQWNEAGLTVDRKLWFQFQAALMGSDGVLLWSGTMSGWVKAGGVGASPRDKDSMARSCGELAIQEMMNRLPRCVH